MTSFLSASSFRPLSCSSASLFPSVHHFLISLCFISACSSVAVENRRLNNLAATSDVRQCPCTFYVATSLNAPPLDFILKANRTGLSASTLTRETVKHIYYKKARFARHAFHQDGLLAYHELHFPHPASVQLSVFEHNPAGTILPIHVHILPSLNQVSTCPSLIPNDPPAQSQRFLVPNVPSRIFGGSIANQNLAKSLVFLASKLPDGTFIACTGAVISRRTILTAAHCNLSNRTIVLIGETKINTFNLDKRYSVESIHLHPSYPTSSKKNAILYDMAYIILKEDLPDSVPILRVNRDETLPKENSFVRAIGYGLTKYSDLRSGKSLLNQIDLRVFPNSAAGSFVDTYNKNILGAGANQEGCGVW